MKKLKDWKLAFPPKDLDLIFQNTAEQHGSKQQKRGYGKNHNPLILLVGGVGFEPTTSTV